MHLHWPDVQAGWPHLLLIAAVVIHLLMMGSLVWGYLNSLFDNSNVHAQAIDFFSIYEAGNRALDNDSLYAFQESARSPYYTFYRYVPLFGYLVGVPLNVLPAWPSYWLWVAFYEVLLVVNAYVTWRIAGKGTWGLVGAAMWFVFTPFYLEQYMGQFSFLMATALFWLGIGLARGRELASGLPWAASVIMKSNTALLAPVFLRLGWWRPLLVGAALVALNVPYFLAYTKDFEFFYRANSGGFLILEGDRHLLYGAGDQGLAALLRNAFLAADPSLSSVPAAYPFTAMVAIALFSLIATFLARQSDPLLLLGIWTSVFFLSYSVWEHHYVMFLPILVLLIALRPQTRPWALIAFVLIALPTPYWLLDNVWNTQPLSELTIYDNHQVAWPTWGVIVHHAAKPLPVLELWWVLVLLQLRSGLRLPLRLTPAAAAAP